MNDKANSFFESLWSMSSLILVAMLIIFIFLRMQSKKKKARQDLLNGIISGDKVITVGGIIGVVMSVKENTMFLKVSEGVNIEISRDAVYMIMKSDNQNI
jgi:preprotein translocase subunit YajC